MFLCCLGFPDVIIFGASLPMTERAFYWSFETSGQAFFNSTKHYCFCVQNSLPGLICFVGNTDKLRREQVTYQPVCDRAFARLSLGHPYTRLLFFRANLPKWAHTFNPFQHGRHLVLFTPCAFTCHRASLVSYKLVACCFLLPVAFNPRYSEPQTHMYYIWGMKCRTFSSLSDIGGETCVISLQVRCAQLYKMSFGLHVFCSFSWNTL